jgi:carbonic anhydrase/acetyltransferase-like protein (isoleucine patch superfamily)
MVRVAAGVAIVPCSAASVIAAWTRSICSSKTGVTIGDHVIVRPHTMTAADVVVRDYGTVAAQVFLGRHAVVEDNACAGARTKVSEYACGGSWSVVGMGSLVLGRVPCREMWAGTPPRRLAPASRLTDHGPT